MNKKGIGVIGVILIIVGILGFGFILQSGLLGSFILYIKQLVLRN